MDDEQETDVLLGKEKKIDEKVWFQETKIFLYWVYCASLFSEAELSVVSFYSLFSRYQTSVLFVILSNILQSTFVRATGL